MKRAASGVWAAWAAAAIAATGCGGSSAGDEAFAGDPDASADPAPCATAADCAAPANPCEVAVCTGGTCGSAVSPSLSRHSRRRVIGSACSERLAVQAAALASSGRCSARYSAGVFQPSA